LISIGGFVQITDCNPNVIDAIDIARKHLLTRFPMTDYSSVLQFELLVGRVHTRLRQFGGLRPNNGPVSAVRRLVLLCYSVS
jgi:hypothetical protein